MCQIQEASDGRIGKFTLFLFEISQVSRSQVLAKANKEPDSSVWRTRRKSLENIYGKENGTYCSSPWVVEATIQRTKEPEDEIVCSFTCEFLWLPLALLETREDLKQ